jgi:anti-sigma regulatory factor (Ser/Thr protein kinase)
MAGTADDLEEGAAVREVSAACPGGDWRLYSFLELAAVPAAVPRGRHHVGHVLLRWDLAHLAADAEMLVSELLSNAVTASSTAQTTVLLVLRLLASSESLVVEVWDHGHGEPQLRSVGPVSDGGRGLTIVEALSRRWGYQRLSATLKAVWCELPTGR